MILFDWVMIFWNFQQTWNSKAFFSPCLEKMLNKKPPFVSILATRFPWWNFKFNFFLILLLMRNDVKCNRNFFANWISVSLEHRSRYILTTHRKSGSENYLEFLIVGIMWWCFININFFVSTWRLLASRCLNQNFLFWAKTMFRFWSNGQRTEASDTQYVDTNHLRWTIIGRRNEKCLLPFAGVKTFESVEQPW